MYVNTLFTCFMWNISGLHCIKHIFKSTNINTLALCFMWNTSSLHYIKHTSACTNTSTSAPCFMWNISSLQCINLLLNIRETVPPQMKFVRHEQIRVWGRGKQNLKLGASSQSLFLVFIYYFFSLFLACMKVLSSTISFSIFYMFF